MQRQGIVQSSDFWSVIKVLIIFKALCFVGGFVLLFGLLFLNFWLDGR